MIARAAQRHFDAAANRLFYSTATNSTLNEEIIEHLRNKFAKFDRPNHLEYLASKHPDIAKLKRASILVPISAKRLPNSSSFQTFYTLSKRTEQMSSFKGQVCFVGGKKDNDETDVQTALREGKEEIGIEADQLTIVAQMCPLITFNRLLVTPIIAYFDKEKFRPKLSKEEVEYIFELQTERFLDKRGHKSELFKSEAGEYLVHYFSDKVITLDEKQASCTRIAKTWGFTGFMCTLVSTVLHSRLPEFDLMPNSGKLDINNLNQFLEDFLVNKFNVTSSSKTN